MHPLLLSIKSDSFVHPNLIRDGFPLSSRFASGTEVSDGCRFNSKTVVPQDRARRGDTLPAGLHNPKNRTAPPSRMAAHKFQQECWWSAMEHDLHHRGGNFARLDAELVNYRGLAVVSSSSDSGGPAVTRPRMSRSRGSPRELVSPG